MTPTAATAHGARGYGSFAAVAVAVTLLLAAAGWLPTRWLAGPAGTPAMLAGCSIGLVASLVGALPIAFGGGGGDRPALPPVFRALAGLGLRLAVAVVLASAAALSGRLAVGPLIAWTVIGYLVLLAVDTRFALAAASAESGGGDRTEGRDQEETRR